MSQNEGSTPKPNSNFAKNSFPEYEEILRRVKNLWERGDVKPLSEKINETGIEGRKIKSKSYLRIRISNVLTGQVIDRMLLIKMYEYVKPREKLLQKLNQ